MSRLQIAAAAGAILLHGCVLLFGGLLLPRSAQEPLVREDVGLIDEADAEKTEEAAKKDEADKMKPKEEASEPEEQPAIAEPAEPMPDMQDLERLDAPAAGPTLDALSLNDLESALDPSAGGGSFGQGFSLASGGRIGAAGGPGGPAALDDIVSIADLDQRPRPIAQTSPMYPAELRRRHVEGSVSVVFLVDTNGQVLNPAVEKSTDPAFDGPALEAVRHWRFEPGTRRGQRVQFKMRVPITFRTGA